MCYWKPSLVTGKVYNKHLTGNWVAFAKTPSVFPNFPKFFPSLKNSQLYRKIVGCLNFAHEGNFSREKTSLNADVKYNKFGVLKIERGFGLTRRNL